MQGAEPFKFTPGFIFNIVDRCNVPTNDPMLDAAFEEYNGNPAIFDSPVYYRFLFQLAQHTPQALKMVEIGTYKGYASLHFLRGGPSTTLMVDPGNALIERNFIGSNAAFFKMQGNNKRALQGAKLFFGSSIDILFIDSDHTYDSTVQEFELWEPMVRSGGLVLFDDVHAIEALNRKDYGCGRFWRELQQSNRGVGLDFPQLHPEGWGFGIWFKP